MLAHLLIPEECLTFNRLIGVLLGLCGAIALVGTEVLQGLQLQSLGQIAILGAAFSYSGAGV